MIQLSQRSMFKFLLYAYDRGWQPLKFWQSLFWAAWCFEIERVGQEHEAAQGKGLANGPN